MGYNYPVDERLVRVNLVTQNRLRVNRQIESCIATTESGPKRLLSF